MKRWIYALMIGCIALAAVATGAERDWRPTTARIDELVAQQLAKESIPASPPADDAEFLRRVYLDLAGRIPTGEEARNFLDDAAPDKRTRLIDDLLARSDFGRNFADRWVTLMFDPDLAHSYQVNLDPLRTWLAESFNANRPWSDIVTALVAAEGDGEKSPQIGFYQLNSNAALFPEPPLMARSTARLFLGTQIQCAECHDHPFRDLKQTDFWGFASFYDRLDVRQLDAKKKLTVVRDVPYGTELKINNFPSRFVAKEPGIIIPKSAFTAAGSVVKPKFLDGSEPAIDINAPTRPVLAAWMTSRDNTLFARAAVNRWWCFLMGRGIVNPVDDFDAGKPTHPELLDFLAREFTASGHDVKYLVRAIVNAQTYQRTARPAKGNEVDEPLFARMQLKMIPPENLLASYSTALGVEEKQLLAARQREYEGKKEHDPWNTSARINFIDTFRTLAHDDTAYNHGIPQVLRQLNDAALHAGGATVAAATSDTLTTPEQVEALYLAALARRPTAEEARIATEFLDAHRAKISAELAAARRRLALRQQEIPDVAWAWAEGFATASKNVADWKVLTPDHVAAANGATLTPQADGAVLPSGTNAETEEYIVVAKTPLRRLTGLRLEIVKDPSMPRQSPGRGENGEGFALSELIVDAAPTDGADEPVRLAPGRIFGNWWWKAEIPDFALDADTATAWRMGANEPHTLIVAYDVPAESPSGWTLTVRLQQLAGRHHNVGRFRLSVSDGSPELFGNSVPPPAPLGRFAEQPADKRRKEEVTGTFAQYDLIAARHQALVAAKEQALSDAHRRLLWELLSRHEFAFNH